MSRRTATFFWAFGWGYKMALTDIVPDAETLALGLGAPARGAFAVTPDDATDFTTQARALYIGSAGDVKVRTWKDEDITFIGVIASYILPVRCKRVFATGTTASSIVGLY